MTDEELIERLRWRRESLDAAAADRIEALVKERDEATNQLDSARHSVDVLEKRVEALVKERDTTWNAAIRAAAFEVSRYNTGRGSGAATARAAIARILSLLKP